MTAQQECSQCPLVEMESTTSLHILFICSYDSTTGVFTVPPGGDGVYYFSSYFLVDQGDYGRFDIMLNDDIICTTWPDQNASSDLAPGSCSAVVDVVAGKLLTLERCGQFRPHGLICINFIESIEFYHNSCLVRGIQHKKFTKIPRPEQELNPDRSLSWQAP